MNTKDVVKLLAKDRKITIAELERNLGIANGTIGKWDKQNPTTEPLRKLADYFNVSTDYLLGREEKAPYYQLNEKEKNDIAIQADLLLEGIENGDNLNFYGEPATEEQKDRLLLALKMAMEMNKEEAKKKFTAKKYRNDE